MVGIRVLRALLFQGTRREAGALLTVSELDAANLVASSRAELVNADDFAAVRKAIEAQNVRLCPGRPPREGPWRNVGNFQ